MSHDLRGPLNSLIGFTDILGAEVDGPLTPGQVESVEALARGGRELLRRVDDLLDAARLDAGRMTLDRSRVSLRELLDAARADLHAVAEEMASSGADAPGGDAMAAARAAAQAAMAAMRVDQRRAITARLEGARLRSFVLAGVSHDLRGPLNSLIGFTDILGAEVDGPLTPGQVESVEALARGGRELLRRVDDLLDAARLDAGRMTLDRSRVSLRELLDAARAIALERLGEAGASTEGLRVDGALDATAVVDRGRMAQALGALLAFARAASTEGARAEVRVDPEGGCAVTLAVPGTRELRAWLEDPLEVPPAGVRAPVGLGLAVSVARRVIALHGGALEADDAVDGRITLRARLPGG